ncbi:MAG TPA: FtsQ-type POTRA domain-containing protein, partial [Gemmatimonadales bacterium]|nr:FtsQ-type POTRA domain-containing protein [Gemmatimonadales bacterium]
RLEFFRVRRVEIEGSRYLAPAKIIAALGLHDRSSVFDDLPAAGAGLRALPGVHSAIVRRRLPGTLEIAIEEAVPVALAPRGAALTLLDSGGRVLPFDPAANAPDLPIAATVDRTVAQVLAAVQQHDSVLFGRIETARRMHDDVVLEVDGRQIWFPSEVTAEGIRAVTAVAEDLARQGRDYRQLDGRFAGQVIVRWEGA